MYVEIRALLKQKYSISAIAKKLNISRTTIYRYIKKSPEEMAEWQASTRVRRKKLDEHKDLILKWLREFPDLTAAQVHDWLQEKLSESHVGESTVRSYVHSLRDDFDIPKEKTTREYQAVPELPMGEQTQVDFGYSTVRDKRGKPVKVSFIAFVLSHSRYKYVEFLNRPFTAVDVVEAHKHAFKVFEGVTKEIVYDQDRLMVVSENNGDLLLTEEFRGFVNEMKFNVHLCRKADPESKGKIENVVGFVKKNFINNRVYTHIDSWNEQCIKWLKRTGNGRIHNGTKKRPAEVFLLEKQHLRQVNQLIKNSTPSISRSVRKDNVIMYLSNRYSVPLGTFSKYPEVHIQMDKDQLLIYVQDTGEVLATHSICKDKGKLIQNRSHLRDTTKGIDELIDNVSGFFTDQQQARFYCEALHQKYPRYIRDQLLLMKKCIERGSFQILDDSLTLCIERQLFSANDFKDVVTLLHRQQQVDNTSDSAGVCEIMSADMDDLTRDVDTEHRSFEKYVEIMEESLS